MSSSLGSGVRPASCRPALCECFARHGCPIGLADRASSGEHASMSDATASVRITLLGGFAVVVDGAVVTAPWRLRKAKTLVKLLALRTGHRLHRDVLVDQLWPEADPSVGANNLHQALHAARRIVGAPHLLLTDDVVELGGDGV